MVEGPFHYSFKYKMPHDYQRKNAEMESQTMPWKCRSRPDATNDKSIKGDVTGLTRTVKYFEHNFQPRFCLQRTVLEFLFHIQPTGVKQ